MSTIKNLEGCNAQQCVFEDVQGYATPAKAQKRGEELARNRADVAYRWAVIVLANGRFAPLVICNNSVPGGPGLFLGERNVCITN